MSNLSRKIREARRRRGLSQADFAKEVGVTQSTVSKWESGAQRPDFDAVMRLSTWSGDPADKFLDLDYDHPFATSDEGFFVDIVGSVESERWLERIEWDREDHFRVLIPTPRTIEVNNVKGWIVKDIAIEKLYPLESIVFCRETSDVDQIGNYDRVLVVRENTNGLFEVTVREIAKYKDIIVNLRAHSKNPSPEQHFDLKPLRLPQGIVSIRVIGVVVASFALEPERSPEPDPGWSL